MNARFSKNIENKGKVTLDNFRNLTYIRSNLPFKSFAWKRAYSISSKLKTSRS